jgi:hypothetical protein
MTLTGTYTNRDGEDWTVSFDYTPADRTPVGPTTVSPPDPARVQDIEVRDVYEGVWERERDAIEEWAYEYGAENWDADREPPDEDDYTD